MGKPIIAPESFVDLPFPVKGIDVATELEHQPPQTTPVGVNVRAFEPSTQRARGGARPGLVEYLNTQVAGFASKIQHLNVIVDPTTDALTSEDDTGDTIEDPSTNNLSIRNPVPHRRVRRGGSGGQPNKKKKKPPLAVTVTATDQSKPKGQDFTFAGTEFTNDAMAPGDVLTKVTLLSDGSPAGANVGTYPIVPSRAVVQNTSARKYKFNYVNGTMAVTSALIQFVQSNAGTCTGNDHTNFRNFPAPVTAGNLLVVFIGWPTVGDSWTVFDDLGTPLTASPQSSSGTLRMQMWYGIAPASGANFVTLKTTGGGGEVGGVAVLEYSGVKAVAPLDAVQTSTSADHPSPTALTTTPIPVSSSGELILGAFGQNINDLAFIPDAGFNLRASFTDGLDFLGIYIADKIGVAVTQPVTGTLVGAIGGYVGFGSSFKAA
jgi:hypothetical protein